MLSLSDRRKREQQTSKNARLKFPLTGRVWLALLVGALLAVCLSTDLQGQQYVVKLGQPVPRDIRAPVPRLLLGAGSQTRAGAAAPPRLVEDREAALNALDGLDAAALQIQAARGAKSTAPAMIPPDLKALPVSIPPSTLVWFLRAPTPRVDAALRVAASALTLEMTERPITGRPGDLDLARGDLQVRAASLVPDREGARQAATLAGAFLRPTLLPDSSAPGPLAAGVLRRATSLQPRQGAVIARKGEIATPELLKQLESLGLAGTSGGAWWHVCLGALAIGSMLMVLAYIRLYFPALYQDTLRMGLLGFIVVSGVGALLTLGFVLGLRLSPSQFGFFALMWVTATAMLVATLVRSEVAVLVSALLSIHTAILLGGQMEFGVACLFSALAGVFSIRRMRSRAAILQSMAILAGVNLLSVSVLTVWNVGPGTAGLKLDLGIAIAWALFAGVGSPFLFFMGVAMLERPFRVTTDLTLLELCDSHQPLLRRLVLEAPGTYAHSLGVANLAEAAAEAIHAETLWCRAGALYHDVGKINRPYFFVENQQGENLHKKLSPTMSSKIITAHITDGVEMAREARVPERLIDFIRQHHGTSLVTYFYHQAIITSDTPAGISESQFRYPGPRPQTREAGILMLADAVESTVRSAMMRRNPGRLEAIVSRVVQNRLADGQLSECDLTLREIDRIQAAFVRTLSAMSHARIEYPAAEPAEEGLAASAGAGR